MNDDARETAAAIFERTGNLAASLAGAAPSSAAAALTVASGIANAIAGVIRTLGVDGAREAVEELVRRRDEGVITDADIAKDDARIRSRVAALFAYEDPQDE